MRALADAYLIGARNGLQNQLQYRTATAFAMIGFLIEPIVYLVVWTTIADSQGGSIAGYSTDDFIGYYIAWTLVRAMNISLTPYVWDGRIQRGRINDHLMQPWHLFHRDFSWFSGWKPVWLAWWVPLAAILLLVFRPNLEVVLWQIPAFFIAVVFGYTLRFILLYLLGMVSFWTTRASALFELVVAGEILLSGRLVPLDLMPDWVQTLAAWLPFKWTYQAPIEIAIGRSSALETLATYGWQILWIGLLGVVFAAVWRRAVRRYSAVGV